MSDRKILLVGCAEGDWEALYVNGEKKCEGHSISLHEVFEALEIKVDYFSHPEPEDPGKADPKAMFHKKWKS
jgi:hypothetical protein